MKILIAGDSFAANHTNRSSWNNLLSNDFLVDTVAQAGVGEYKILQQIKRVCLLDYDFIIVSHTSPYRIHVPSHPIYKTGYHKDCDIIINDIIGKSCWSNLKLFYARKWIEHYYDETYQLDTYNLFRHEINRSIKIPYISISHLPIEEIRPVEECHIDFSQLWQKERGQVNHYTDNGNRIVYETVLKQINSYRPRIL